MVWVSVVVLGSLGKKVINELSIHGQEDRWMRRGSRSKVRRKRHVRFGHARKFWKLTPTLAYSYSTCTINFEVTSAKIHIYGLGFRYGLVLLLRQPPACNFPVVRWTTNFAVTYANMFILRLAFYHTWTLFPFVVFPVTARQCLWVLHISCLLDTPCFLIASNWCSTFGLTTASETRTVADFGNSATKLNRSLDKSRTRVDTYHSCHLTE